jgi:hypothetical protein
MYEVTNGISVKDKYFAKGDIVNSKDIPQNSIKWLVEQGELVKITKNYKEKKLHEIAMDMAKEEEE